MKSIRVSIVGGSGYTGGELLRILLGHPFVEVVQVTSERYAGKFVQSVHPNLRRLSSLQFVSSEGLEMCDLLFLCLPHGVSMKRMDVYRKMASRIIDLSGDFRLKNQEDYETWYGHEHSHPELLKEFVYGIPEIHREDMRSAHLISSAGCLATSAILAMYPLFREGVVEERVVVDAKVGSSATGNKPSLATHHAERSRTVRSYAPSMHRHTAEMEQELSVEEGGPVVSFSPHAIELVRGILSTCHLFLKRKMTEKEIWQIYRKYYGDEPFIRLVKEKMGVYRYPEPKILVGSNFCDIGFEVDPRSNRLIVMAAIDNLMKGAAGQAVQAMNIMIGCDERTGLEFPGLHPV